MAATRSAQFRVVPLCRGLLGRRALSSGSSGKDADFEALFADMPPARSASSSAPPAHSSASAAATGTGESALWKSLVVEPSSTTPAKWGFLKDINKSQPRYSNPRTDASSSSSPSFRKLGGDIGFEFLKDALDQPATTGSEQQEAGEQVQVMSASFKLLRDSFQKASSGETFGTSLKLDDVLGMDSSLLSNVDSRSLAEVEGNFYSTMDQTPVEDIKTYTYEELGEKLRQARPPVEQMLSSATGLSFGELRTRFQKIEQAKNEARENQDAHNDFTELRESLSHLKPMDSPKSSAAKKQLSYEELAFVNHVGMRPGFRVKLEYTPPKDDLLTKYYSDVQLSSMERLKLEIKKLREAFQIHDCDSGSPQVQIAILTARINNLNRHMREGPNYKRDKHSKKGLSDMVQYRRRLLRYLRRRDWPAYCNVLTKLKLDDVILEKRR